MESLRAKCLHVKETGAVLNTDFYYNLGDAYNGTLSHQHELGDSAIPVQTFHLNRIVDVGSYGQLFNWNW